jgi:ribosomal protein S24E
MFKMKIEITNEVKNSLLNRKEVEFQVVEKITPSRESLQKEIAKAAKGKPELVVIDMVGQRSGSNLTVGRAKVYDNDKVMAEVELAYRQKRGVKEKPEGEESTEEAPAEKKEEPKEEAPAQEPKEETKEETKEEASEEKKEEAEKSE